MPLGGSNHDGEHGIANDNEGEKFSGLLNSIAIVAAAAIIGGVVYELAYFWVSKEWWARVPEGGHWAPPDPGEFDPDHYHNDNLPHASLGFSSRPLLSAGGRLLLNALLQHTAN